jgi:glycosyltransferase 2 family protein
VSTGNRLGRVVRLLFAAAGLAFVGMELAGHWHQAERLGRSWPRIFVAALLSLVVLAFGARAWAALLGRPRSAGLRHGFYLSQLGKYVPGGIWQATGQVGFARDEGVALGEASAAFPVYAVVQVVASATVAAAAALGATGLRPSRRGLILAGVILVVVLHRGWMRRVVDLAARAVTRLHAGLLPGAGAIVRAYLWSAASLLLAGVAFAVLLEPGGIAWWFAAIAAFGTAWWIGFVALPFPSGIGVREAVLVGLLTPHLSTGSILAAALGQRIVAIVAEITIIAVSALRRRRARTTTDPSVDPLVGPRAAAP